MLLLWVYMVCLCFMCGFYPISLFHKLGNFQPFFLSSHFERGFFLLSASGISEHGISHDILTLNVYISNFYRLMTVLEATDIFTLWYICVFEIFNKPLFRTTCLWFMVENIGQTIDQVWFSWKGRINVVVIMYHRGVSFIGYNIYFIDCNIWNLCFSFRQTYWKTERHKINKMQIFFFLLTQYWNVGATTRYTFHSFSNKSLSFILDHANSTNFPFSFYYLFARRFYGLYCHWSFFSLSPFPAYNFIVNKSLKW